MNSCLINGKNVYILIMNNFNLKVFDMQQYKVDNLGNMKTVIERLTNDIKIKYSISEEKDFDIRLVLSELIMNAFKHSKHGGFVDVYLESDYNDEKIRIIVEDYGYGFDLKSVSESSDLKNLYDNGGRGIKLVKALCEKVKYNESGNSVSVVIKV